jgi:hypothetical protein
MKYLIDFNNKDVILESKLKLIANKRDFNPATSLQN